MKKNGLFFYLAVLAPLAGLAQFTAGYHQSGLPFVSVSYEFRERYKAEVRLGTDIQLGDVPVELVGLYDFRQREDFEFYVGFGIRQGFFPGAVIPVGLNVYPFPEKKFGFHMELATVIGEDEIVRGSWGIRYRF